MLYNNSSTYSGDDFMTIDFHTHIFPDKIAERTIKLLEDNTERVEGVRARAATDGTLGGLEKSMKDNDIDYSVVMPIATTVTQSNTINNFAASINGKNNIFSFGSVHPFQENCLDELERVKALGLRGIKLHPEYQGVYADSPECVRAIKKCMELGLLVLLHTGRDIGIEPPVHCEPRRLRRVLDMTGADNIIAAHMGGWRMWDEAEELLAGQNLYLDTSYSLNEMSGEQAVRFIKKHGADKILYGTDSPWEKQSICRERINALPVSNEEKELILHKNAARLLNI
jgi:hypothetical protein